MHNTKSIYSVDFKISEYMHQMEKYYAMYILKNENMPASHPVIRPEIYESWKRSKSNGVDPLLLKFNLKKLDSEEFNRHLSENDYLLKIAEPYIDTLYNFVRGSNFVIHLTDQSGCIMKYYADDEQIANLFKNTSKLDIGVIRSEQISGTDSSALCLAIDKPIQVIGPEHYLKANHAFFCNSAPIHNKEGLLIGVLTIMGPVELYQSHTLGMACAAAAGIEQALENSEINQQLTLINYSTLDAIIENIPSGILTTDSDGNIISYNDGFVKIFHLPGDTDFHNMDIFSVIDKNNIPENFRTSISNPTAICDDFMKIATVYGSTAEVFVTVKGIRPLDKKHFIKTFYFKGPKEAKAIVRKFGNLHASYTFNQIIGESNLLKNAIHLGKNAAHSSSNVLILGESGTGKELFAQSIHNASSRKDMPFVALNCGAIPKNLIESELFGYEGGAFTGANKTGRPGKFELADKGTLFLDEIGDMPLELQVSLLRVLQSHEVIRVGGKYPKKIDVRIIAATNIDLLNAVHNKAFRSDLYYRLNVLSLTLPPLRERKEDIPVLTKKFIANYARSLNRTDCSITDEAMQTLIRYSWPGNVRELENVIERALNIIPDHLITEEDLPDNLFHENRQSHRRTTAQTALPQSYDTSNSLSPEIVERNTIIETMIAEHGHVQSVADTLNLPASTLYRKLKKYNISIKDFKKW